MYFPKSLNKSTSFYFSEELQYHLVQHRRVQHRRVQHCKTCHHHLSTTNTSKHASRRSWVRIVSLCDPPSKLCFLRANTAHVATYKVFPCGNLTVANNMVVDGDGDAWPQATKDFASAAGVQSNDALFRIIAVT